MLRPVDLRSALSEGSDPMGVAVVVE